MAQWCYRVVGVGFTGVRGHFSLLALSGRTIRQLNRAESTLPHTDCATFIATRRFIRGIRSFSTTQDDPGWVWIGVRSSNLQNNCCGGLHWRHGWNMKHLRSSPSGCCSELRGVGGHTPSHDPHVRASFGNLLQPQHSQHFQGFMKMTTDSVPSEGFLIGVYACAPFGRRNYTLIKWKQRK
ncbi:hypothetical protein SRHO_G00122040 [Serrasalmus rhombeus]